MKKIIVGCLIAVGLVTGAGASEYGDRESLEYGCLNIKNVCKSLPEPFKNLAKKSKEPYKVKRYIDIDILILTPKGTTLNFLLFKNIEDCNRFVLSY